MEKKKQSLYVIFGPEQPGGLDRVYISHNGNRTSALTDAARFFSYQSAVDFAKGHGITLDTHTFIKLEDFFH